MAGRKDAEGEKTVASNRRARHDYLLLEQVECGIRLTGDEVKSLKGGRASLTDCYARVRSGEMWLEGMHVPAYEQGDKRTHEPLRPRKLLLHRNQIAHLEAEVREKGLALVPLRVYVTHGMLKVEIALARGKRQHEKRHAIAKRDAEREAERELSRRR